MIGRSSRPEAAAVSFSKYESSSHSYRAIILSAALSATLAATARLPECPEVVFFHASRPRPRLQRWSRPAARPIRRSQVRAAAAEPQTKPQVPAGAAGRSRRRPDRPRRKGIPVWAGQLSRRPPRSRQAEFRLRLQPASRQRLRSSLQFRRPPRARTRPHSGRHQRPRTRRLAAGRRLCRAEVRTGADRRSQRSSLPLSTRKSRPRPKPRSRPRIPICR